MTQILDVFFFFSLILIRGVTRSCLWILSNESGYFWFVQESHAEEGGTSEERRTPKHWTSPTSNCASHSTCSTYTVAWRKEHPDEHQRMNSHRQDILAHGWLFERSDQIINERGS